MKELAAERRRYGSPRLTVLLRREGFVDNHKRIERIYGEEGLQVRRRKRKRTAPGGHPNSPTRGHLKIPHPA